MNNTKHKIYAGTSQFRGESNNLLEVRAYIEFDKYGFRAVSQFTVYRNRNRDNDNTLTMQFNMHQLRQIIQAMIHIEKNDKGYAFFTGGDQSKKKMLISLKDNTYYLNFSLGENKIHTAFTFLQIQGIVDSLTCVANKIESHAVEMEINKSQLEFKAIGIKKEKEKKMEYENEILRLLDSIEKGFLNSKVLVACDE